MNGKTEYVICTDLPAGEPLYYLGDGLWDREPLLALSVVHVQTARCLANLVASMIGQPAYWCRFDVDSGDAETGAAS